MLNLPIAMLKFFLILALFIQDATIAVTSPAPGEILRGMVEIQGRMEAPNFASAELAFTYLTAASDPAAAWFTLQTFSQPTAGPVLTAWDTTAVTDGDYALRLRVNFQDGTFQDILITDLKIRNDVPLPTATPTETPTATPTLPSFSQFKCHPCPAFIFPGDAYSDYDFSNRHTSPNQSCDSNRLFHLYYLLAKRRPDPQRVCLFLPHPPPPQKHLTPGT